MWRAFVEPLVQEPDPESEELERCRELCRKGNPFPLVALQWPHLVVTDPVEIEIFKRSMTAERFEHLTDNIRKACFNPDNPPLRLDWWQKIALAAFFDPTVVEIGEKGATKVGKGASTSMGICLWFDVWSECKIVLTSQRADHAKKVIFGETVKWQSKMTYKRGNVTTEGINDTTEHYVTIANPESGEGFSGQHGPKTLFVFDEATSIPDGFYDDAGKQASKILALANPRTLAGWFRSMYKPCADPNKTQVVRGPFGKRLCMTIDGAEVINVVEKRLEKPLSPCCGIEINGTNYPPGEDIAQEDFALVKPLIPEQCDFGRHMGIRAHPDPNHVSVFGHGHFPTEDALRQIILGTWLARHNEYHKKHASEIDVNCFGFDVARSLDGDQSCLAIGGKKGCKTLVKWQYANTAFHVDEVLRQAREVGIDLTLGQNPVCVDMDGIGAGVGDELRRRSVWVIEFRGNATSQFDPKTYMNLRAEAYGLLGRRLNPEDRWENEPWGLPFDADLNEELTAPEKVFSGTDALRFRISPKSPTPGKEGDKVISIKEKIGRSPDTADAVVYLYHAVREYHSLNEWLANLQSRQVVLHPRTKEDAIVRKKELEQYEKTEWDDVKWGWGIKSNSEPMRTTVAEPDKNPRKPWWEQYTRE